MDGPHAAPRCPPATTPPDHVKYRGAIGEPDKNFAARKGICNWAEGRGEELRSGLHRKE